MGIDQFNLSGAYKLNGQHVFLGGNLSCFIEEVAGEDKNEFGSFESLLVEKTEANSQLVIKGQIKKIEDLALIEFFTFPKDSQFAEKYFRLEKSGKDSNGKYVGTWQAIKPGLIGYDFHAPSMIDSLNEKVLDKNKFYAELTSN